MPEVPAQPRNAATVALLRDADSGIEVYLLERRSTMAFAPGMFVFPGGSVDERDAELTIGWVGPPAGEWARRFHCDEGLARALVCAAVRETYEESGVLLAGTATGTVVTDTTGDEWEADRLALLDRSLSLAQVLARRELVLRADLLGAWAHWITPESEPRRYDTRFFVAVVPSGQRTSDVSGEAQSVIWLPPATALRRVDAGEMAMMPPTYETCAELAQLPSASEAVATAAARRIQTILPLDAELQ